MSQGPRSSWGEFTFVDAADTDFYWTSLSLFSFSRGQIGLARGPSRWVLGIGMFFFSGKVLFRLGYGFIGSHILRVNFTQVL